MRSVVTTTKCDTFEMTMRLSDCGSLGADGTGWLGRRDDDQDTKCNAVSVVTTRCGGDESVSRTRYRSPKCIENRGTSAPWMQQISGRLSRTGAGGMSSTIVEIMITIAPLTRKRKKREQVSLTPDLE